MKLISKLLLPRQKREEFSQDLYGNFWIPFQSGHGIEQFSGIAFDLEVGRAKNTLTVFNE